MASLILRDGSERGRRVDLEAEEITLGRENTDVVIDDDKEISRRHAVVRSGAEGLIIDDLDSTNGTFVNEQRISGPTRLHNGDTIRVGQTRIDVSVEEEDPNKTQISGLVLPPTQEHPAPPAPRPGASMPMPVEPEVRAPTEELPARKRVGTGGVIRPGKDRRLAFIAAGVIVAVVVGYLLYSALDGGPPSREEYVASVNDICREGVGRLDDLNLNRPRSVERASTLLTGVISDIEELDSPEDGTLRTNRFISSLKAVRNQLRNLSVSQQANNDRRAREAARRLERGVRRLNSQSNRIGVNQCSLRS